jgi:hypothetical protein
MAHDDEDDGKGTDAAGAPKTLLFTYFKANQFRVIHADGAIGGLVHRGGIYMNLFSERVPIPQQQTFEISSDGKLGDEVKEKRVVREGVIREVEVSVVMELHTARALRVWLDAQIKTAEELKLGRKAEAAAKKNDDIAH